jgi:hypothetical protein
MKSGAERQAAYRARKIGRGGDGVRVDLIVSVHAAVVLKRLTRHHRVTEATALADALKVAEAALLAPMTPAERREYLRVIRVAGVPFVA